MPHAGAICEQRVWALDCVCRRLQVRSLDTWTHAYSFWEGVPVASRRAFARLFRASKTLQVRLSLLTAYTDTPLHGSRMKGLGRSSSMMR